MQLWGQCELRTTQGSLNLQHPVDVPEGHYHRLQFRPTTRSDAFHH